MRCVIAIFSDLALLRNISILDYDLWLSWVDFRRQKLHSAVKLHHILTLHAQAIKLVSISLLAYRYLNPIKVMDYLKSFSEPLRHRGYRYPPFLQQDRFDLGGFLQKVFTARWLNQDLNFHRPGTKLAQPVCLLHSFDVNSESHQQWHLFADCLGELVQLLYLGE